MKTNRLNELFIANKSIASVVMTSVEAIEIFTQILAIIIMFD